MERARRPDRRPGYARRGAEAANARHLNELAFRAAAPAAAAEAPGAIRAVLNSLDNHPDVEAWLRFGAGHGDEIAYWHLIQALMEKGLVAEAGTYLRSFVEHTRGRYMHDMLGLLDKAGCLEAALGWLQPYVERRDSAAVDGAVYVLSRLERPRNAINLVREFGDLDDPNLQSGLARFYEAVGETQNMLDCYRAAAESGDVYRTRRFADELERAGRLDDALLWYQRAVEAGGRKEWSTLPSG